jgi:amino acid transporter
MAEQNVEGKGKAKGNRFGTFAGVFTPSILTILGVIMFMRANFVVGHAGIFHAIIILVFAKSITLLTGLSASAIGTNMRVKGGGAYYLISRVLGPEFGGAIGIALFCALALSVPFYIIGFSEALLISFPGVKTSLVGVHPQLPAMITFLTAALLFGVAYVGAGWAIRTQYLIMAFLVLAILAFMGGQIVNFSAERFAANWSAADAESLPGVTVLPFWVLFAIYFPAVTGIDAGINMSGDLEDPARSIPRGTLAAVGVGFAVYLAQMLLSGGAYDRAAMHANPYGLLRENAIFGLGILVVLGVFAATLSSALGSYLGAPRVLQAVSRDRIVKPLSFFAKGSPGKDEPRRALIFTGVITLALLTFAMFMKGNALNAVAAVISMFFLCSYGMINAAAFVEAVGYNPSFRPRFRFFHWVLAGLGALGCAVAMFLISPLAATIAILTIAAFYWYVRKQHLKSHFGDARRGWVFATAMRNLNSLAGMDEDEKNWRPTPLVLAGNPRNREVVVRYAVWLEAGHGIMLLANVLTGKVEELAGHRRTALKKLSELCADEEVHAFPLVLASEDRDLGVRAVMQAASVGPVRPNMLVAGWSDEPERVVAYWKNLSVAATLGMGLVLVVDRGLPAPEKPERRVDVWWRGRKNGSLMLLLAHLLSTNREWEGVQVRLLRVVDDPEGLTPAEEALSRLAHDARLEVTPKVIVSEEPFPRVLRAHSCDATCVFLGFDLPPEGEAEGEARYRSTCALLEGLPTTVLISSQGAEDVTA